MDGYKHIETCIGRYIAGNYARAVEVGIGRNTDAARILSGVRPQDNPFVIFQTARIAYHRRDRAALRHGHGAEAVPLELEEMGFGIEGLAVNGQHGGDEERQ